MKTNFGKNLFCVGLMSGLLFLGGNVEAKCLNHQMHFTENNICVNDIAVKWNDTNDDDMIYLASKKKYQCKICNRVFNTMLVALGHVKGVHNKFFTLPHIRTIKG